MSGLTRIYKKVYCAKKKIPDLTVLKFINYVIFQIIMIALTREQKLVLTLAEVVLGSQLIKSDFHNYDKKNIKIFLFETRNCILALLVPVLANYKKISFRQLLLFHKRGS